MNTHAQQTSPVLRASTQAFIEHTGNHSFRTVANNRIKRGAVLENALLRPADDLYWFAWADDQLVIGSGFAQAYNHAHQPNLYVVRNHENDTLYFWAIRDIQAGEELTHFYLDWYRYTSDSTSDKTRATPNAIIDKALEDTLQAQSIAEHFIHEDLYLAPSAVDRMGVFTARPIPAQTLVEASVVSPVDQCQWVNQSDAPMFCSGVCHFCGVSDEASNFGLQYSPQQDVLAFVALQDIAEGAEIILPAGGFVN